MTANEKINEALAIIQRINYTLNNDSKERKYIDDWIDELKAEPINDEPVQLTFSHDVVKEMILNQIVE